MPLADFTKCINIAVEKGRISKKVGQELLKAENTDAVLGSMIDRLTRTKREAAISALRLDAAYRMVKAHPESQYLGLSSLLDRDMSRQSKSVNVTKRESYYIGNYEAQVREMISALKTRKLGLVQDTDTLKQVIRAIYGETEGVSAEAKKFADSWTRLDDIMVADGNRLGKSVTKNERYNVPQTHNRRAVKKMGEEKWVAYIWDKLDRSKMLNDIGEELTDDQLLKALKASHAAIISDGLSKTADLQVPLLAKKLSRKGSEKRFLYFKDADSWIDYQTTMGKGDIFSTLTDNIHANAHDNAMLEIFGPNPNEVFQALRAQVIKDTGLSGVKLSFLDAKWNVISGKIGEGNLTTAADGMQSMQNVLVASLLDGAFLSAIADVGLSILTTTANGMSSFKMIKRHMSMLNPANEADRLTAMRIGLTAGAATDHALYANRFGSVAGSGVTAKMAEGVMRGTWLSIWTDAGRKAFGMEFSAMLADNFGKSFDELNNIFKGGVAEYGITKQDWDIFRAEKHINNEGVIFADLTHSSAKKFHQMMMTETDFAVPMPDNNVRAMMTGGLGRATTGGMVMKAATTFMGFPLTMMATHLRKGAAKQGPSGKLASLSMLAVTLTVFGAISQQAKSVTKGEHLRDMDDPKFLVDSLIQGGSLGIFDVILKDVNRYGDKPTSGFLGPLGTLVDDTIQLTFGNARQVVTGEDTNIGGESVAFASRYLPNPWQGRLVLDSLYDQFAIAADPNAQKKFNRRMRARERDDGVQYFRRRGQTITEALK